MKIKWFLTQLFIVICFLTSSIFGFAFQSENVLKLDLNDDSNFFQVSEDRSFSWIVPHWYFNDSLNQPEILFTNHFLSDQQPFVQDILKQSSALSSFLNSKLTFFKAFNKTSIHVNANPFYTITLSESKINQISHFPGLLTNNETINLASTKVADSLYKKFLNAISNSQKRNASLAGFFE